MPALVIACDYPACGFSHRTLVGAELPARCPRCHRSGRWRVAPIAIHFTHNDRVFLKSIRTSAE